LIPGAFDYHRPNSLDEAVGLLASLGGEARLLAGGHSLIPLMKLRMATPEHLIDLQAVAELKGIREEAGALVIGAMTTQAEAIASRLLADKCPILAETASQISDPQVRNLGTVGGNVANGDPGNDLPAVMQALAATYLVRGPDGGREIAARDFYEAAYFTKLAEGEILTAVRIPVPAPGHGWAYEKQKRKIGDYATAAAAVVLKIAGGRCESAAVALSNLADTPLYAEGASEALVGSPVDAEAIAAAAREAEAIASPASDGRGPAEFRRKVAGVMVRRAVERALVRAQQ
jgi:aerobic carbon-monoxide dehydrogenase medium subunit